MQRVAKDMCHQISLDHPPEEETSGLMGGLGLMSSMVDNKASLTILTLVHDVTTIKNPRMARSLSHLLMMNIEMRSVAQQILTTWVNPFEIIRDPGRPCEA